MSKKPVTHVAIVVDQSGSMFATKAEAVKGYNEQVQQAKINAKDQDIFGYLVTFNGEIFEHIWGEPAEKLNEANENDFIAEGATALRDAIGYTVNKLLATTDSTDENVSYLVVVISDGDENSSKHFKRLADWEIREGKKDVLKSLLEEVQSTKRWTFTYMGCEDEYIRKFASETSIPLANCAKWSNASPAMAMRGMIQNKHSLSGYYKGRAGGSSCSANVYSADSCKMADFTEEVPGNLPIFAVNSLNVMTPDNLNVNVNVMPNATCSTFDPSSPKPFANRSPVAWTK